MQDPIEIRGAIFIKEFDSIGKSIWIQIRGVTFQTNDSEQEIETDRT